MSVISLKFLLEVDTEVGEAVDEAVMAKEDKEEKVETRDYPQLPRR